jgi:hypothetical protein
MTITPCYAPDPGTPTNPRNPMGFVVSVHRGSPTLGSGGGVIQTQLQTDRPADEEDSDNLVGLTRREQQAAPSNLPPALIPNGGIWMNWATSANGEGRIHFNFALPSLQALVSPSTFSASNRASVEINASDPSGARVMLQVLDRCFIRVDESNRDIATGYGWADIRANGPRPSHWTLTVFATGTGVLVSALAAARIPTDPDPLPDPSVDCFLVVKCALPVSIQALLPHA